MYSVVVAAVLTAGSPAPSFGGFHSRNNAPQGCAGCMGGCISYSCMGCQGCSGCFGSCNGCNGGCNGFLGLGVTCFFQNVFSLGGGSGCSGCNGCFGNSCGGCMGCFGGCQGCFGGMSASYDIPMSFGSMPMMGASPMMMGSTPMMAGPTGSPMISGPNYNMPPLLNPGMNPNAMPNQAIPFGPPPQSYESQTPTDQATVIVTLPADARLYVDGQLMTLTGAVRTFRAPDLKPNLRYTYTIRMEVERNGKRLEDSKTVELQPGKTTQVVFTEPAATGGTARLDIKVPAGATLTVEGQTFSAGQQSIQTPALEVGKNYVYTMKLENDRDGQKETLTRDVSFRAGEIVTVSFDALAKR